MSAPTPARVPRGGVDRRSAARLAAVQALYQADEGSEDPETLILDFLTFRRGAQLDPEADGDDPVAMDTALFEDIVRGSLRRREAIDELLSESLSENWPLHRLERVLRAILRGAAYELLGREDIPPRATISEYLDIAHAFFEGDESKLVNGVLNTLARRAREGELLAVRDVASDAESG